VTYLAARAPRAAAKYYLTNAGAFWRIENLRTSPEAPRRASLGLHVGGLRRKKFEALASTTRAGPPELQFNEIRPGVEGPGARAYAAA